MVAGAYSNAHLIQQGTNIIGVVVSKQEGNDACLPIRFADNAQSGDFPQSFSGIIQQILLMARYILVPNLHYVVQCRSQSYDTGNIWCAPLRICGEDLHRSSFRM